MGYENDHAWPKWLVSDQREASGRPDVVAFVSEILTAPVKISGRPIAHLVASTSGTDSDWVVKLIDVYPDGRAYNLDETIQRVRYREGYDRQVFMEEGQIYEVEVSPMSTSNFFEAGHSLRIEVSSSNFPRFTRNLNTGGNNYDETEGVVAHNQVHHSAQYTS